MSDKSVKEIWLENAVVHYEQARNAFLEGDMDTAKRQRDLMLEFLKGIRPSNRAGALGVDDNEYREVLEIE